MKVSRFFSKEELACRHCGELSLPQLFLDQLDTLRLAYGHPIYVNSGYRCPEHPVEKAKGTQSGGAHTRGAIDARVYGADALDLIRAAITLGWSGIGVNQRGPISGRFIHLDRELHRLDAPRPWLWSY